MILIPYLPARQSPYRNRRAITNRIHCHRTKESEAATIGESAGRQKKTKGPLSDSLIVKTRPKGLTDSSKSCLHQLSVLARFFRLSASTWCQRRPLGGDSVRNVRGGGVKRRPWRLAVGSLRRCEELIARRQHPSDGRGDNRTVKKLIANNAGSDFCSGLDSQSLFALIKLQIT
ncbi:hypothetical protein AVEN_188378-1 [Araneus ventricosus]|uniref:Uncharacterized protein n=1 Tax=Araneus ventricosus TaxID=182803 RepID=A0A4Y2ECK7_ARAVE|nr:hypothetical protein AVEN_188378-1 [Araneus ventricosus]